MHCVPRALSEASALVGLLVVLASCDFNPAGVALPKHSADAAASDPTRSADASKADALWAAVDGSVGDAAVPQGPVVDGEAAPPQVTICHTRPPHRDITIVVDSTEVPAHLAHGDHRGPCADDGEGGDPDDGEGGEPDDGEGDD